MVYIVFKKFTMLSVGTPNEKLYTPLPLRRKKPAKDSSPSRGICKSASAFNLFPLSPACNLRWNATQYDITPAPLVIAGPSGSGKSTLLKRLMNEFQDCFGFSISRKLSDVDHCSLD